MFNKNNPGQNPDENNNNKGNNSNFLGLIGAALVSGAAIGTAYYLNKKSNEKKRFKKYTDYFDLEKVKKIDFKPTFLTKPIINSQKNLSKSENINSIENLKELSKTSKDFLKSLLDFSLKSLKEKEEKEEKEKILKEFSKLSKLTNSNIFSLTKLFYSLASTEEEIQRGEFPNFPSHEERTFLWIALSVNSLSIEQFEDFLSLLSFPSLNPSENDSNKIKETKRQIENDVQRTFNSKLFHFKLKSSENIENEKEEKESEKIMLRNILSSYSLYYNKTVGYCQGMNYIVAFLLSFFSSSKIKISEREKEIKTFLVFFSLLHGYKLSLLFSNDLFGLSFAHLSLEKILKENSPKLFSFMKENEITSLSWSTNWFLTLFTYTFERDFLHSIWEGILLQGFIFIIKVAAGILIVEERLDIYNRKGEINICKELSEFPKSFGGESGRKLERERFMEMVYELEIGYGELKEFVESVPGEGESLFEYAVRDFSKMFG